MPQPPDGDFSPEGDSSPEGDPNLDGDSNRDGDRNPDGDRGADAESVGRLIPLVYAELHNLAHGALRGEATGHTLQTTALVHEAYVRLVGTDLEWESSGHFLRVASRAMRRVLVDHARSRTRAKRGGSAPVLLLDTLEELVPAESRPESVLDLDEALERLLSLDERKGRVVELHYFGGLTYDEIADALGVSPATVDRDLRLARAWLFNELRPEGEA
jgi:RNA polymerase sigma factor (TIGR02999 family)